MLAAPKKILIVSYTFPPNPGIGGRRWAKFAKELVANGHDVKVLTFKSGSKSSQTSEWTSDISSYQKHINYQFSGYPKWLENPKTITDKIMYKLSLLYVKIFSEGNYYDKASFLKTTLLTQVQRYINDGYNNVIVTCAPFKMAYWVSEMIDENKHVNFIVDFRDPWVNNLTSYGFNEMSEKRLSFEKNAEEKVLTKFQKIIVVAEEMKRYFLSAYNLPNNKVTVVSNGYDVDDFKTSDTADFNVPFSNPLKKKVVFTGTFYDKSLYLLTELCKVVSASEELKNSFEFHFFGSMSKEGKDLISGNNPNFFFHGNIKLANVYAVIRSSDFCCLFLTDDITYSLSTKFLEYLSQKKPILVFSKGGATGNFVEDNYLGVSMVPGSMHLKLIDIIHGRLPFTSEQTFNIAEYDIKNLTKKVEEVLQ